jgi:lipopolysaccharide/colanic/teichoic acid biosynthesis glycosyltransferase
MKSEQLRNKILAADLAWIPLALAAEQSLRFGQHWGQNPLAPLSFIVYLVCTVFAWVLLSENMDLDGFRGGWRPSSLVSHLLLAVALLMVLLLAIESVSQRYVGRLRLSVFAPLLLLGFLAIRQLALRGVFRRHERGNVRRVVILGSGRLAMELAEKFNHHPELLCQVIGFLCPREEIPASRPVSEIPSAPDTVSTVDVIGLLRRQNVDELILAHTSTSSEILNLVALCRQHAIRVSLVPQPYELYLSRARLLDLGGLPLLQLEEKTEPAFAVIGKRLLDIVLALVFAVPALPILLFCAIALRFSKGRAFRWEDRVGLHGAPFSMLRLNVDHDSPNTSRFDRLLEHFSISELPQFWNVLRGDMSLVGPRPESPERACRYSAWQQERLSMKPGLTGLAQVHGLRDQHPSEDKTSHDLQYILHPSLLKDLSLLIETVWTLTLRLVHAFEGPGSAPVEPSKAAHMAYPGTHSFSEIYQHAHRTESGSD